MFPILNAHQQQQASLLFPIHIYHTNFGFRSYSYTISPPPIPQALLRNAVVAAAGYNGNGGMMQMPGGSGFPIGSMCVCYMLNVVTLRTLVGEAILQFELFITCWTIRCLLIS